jgi:hypothetical protein
MDTRSRDENCTLISLDVQTVFSYNIATLCVNYEIFVWSNLFLRSLKKIYKIFYFLVLSL